MPTNKYVTLTNSNASMSKKFRVIQMSPTLERSDDIQRTLSGTLDKSAGAITAIHQYIFRIYAVDPEAGYGSFENLKSFFLLNNPNGTPSDVITLIDHYGVSHACIFIGSLAPENVTTVLEGVNAIFMCKVALAEIAAILDDTPSA